MMGIRMMNPTSKKTGMASRNAAEVSAAMTRRGPSSWVNLPSQGLGAA